MADAERPKATRLDWRGATQEPAWQVNLGASADDGTFEWHGIASDPEEAKVLAIADAKRAYLLASGASAAGDGAPDIFRVRVVKESEAAQSLHIWPRAWEAMGPGRATRRSRRPARFGNRSWPAPTSRQGTPSGS